jgi:hypothetical protein
VFPPWAVVVGRPVSVPSHLGSEEDVNYMRYDKKTDEHTGRGR